jgi:hypothetical protein
VEKCFLKNGLVNGRKKDRKRKRKEIYFAFQCYHDKAARELPKRFDIYITYFIDFLIVHKI